MKTLHLKSSLLMLCFVSISFLHLPISFGKMASWHPIFSNGETKSTNNTMLLYDQLHLDSLGLSPVAYEKAIEGYTLLTQEGRILNDGVLSIIDFSKPSSKKRLFVIDLYAGALLFNTYVAHGQQSGGAYAEQFSNRPSSYKSSLGFYQTKSTYIGKHGYSLQLDGLEKGINDNAAARAIVIHGAAYVSEGMIKMQGFLGRSWGCPALPEKYTRPIIDKIKNGTCLYIYAADINYFNQSNIVGV